MMFLEDSAGEPGTIFCIEKTRLAGAGGVVADWMSREILKPKEFCGVGLGGVGVFCVFGDDMAIRQTTNFEHRGGCGYADDMELLQHFRCEEADSLAVRTEELMQQIGVAELSAWDIGVEGNGISDTKTSIGTAHLLHLFK